MLSRLYGNGQNLRDVILGITSETPFGSELSTRLISPRDPNEYAEVTMMRSFAAVSPHAPHVQGDLRLEQQSSQAEVSKCQPEMQRYQLSGW